MGTTRIECIDCGEPRDVPNASKHLVKRCKSCQDEYNRVRALERYYERNNRKPKKKKKKEETATQAKSEPSEDGFLSGLKPIEEKSKKREKGVTADMTPDEKEAFFKSLFDRAFGEGYWDSCATHDDW